MSYCTIKSEKVFKKTIIQIIMGSFLSLSTNDNILYNYHYNL